MLTIAGIPSSWCVKSITHKAPAEYAVESASPTAAVCRRSAILGTVQLPAPLFQGGALLGLKGYPVAAGSAKSLNRESASDEGRYFSRKRQKLDVPAPEIDGSSSGSGVPRWVEAFEAQLQEDPNEETWLAYALEVLAPGTEGGAAQVVPSMRKW